MKFPLILLAVCLFTVALFGCPAQNQTDDSANDDDDDSNPPSAAGLVILQGNLQSGFAGGSLPDELVVQAFFADGSPAPNAPINFRLLEGSDEGRGTALLDPAEAITDDQGRATCRITLGAQPGMLRLRAETPQGSARPVTFHLSAYPEPTATKKPICFLSVNDFHCHIAPWGSPDDPQGGIARIAWLFQQIRANNARIGVPTVIFDAGDDFENTVYHDVPGFLAWQIETWDRIGVDVWQVGNHDYHFGLPFLNDQVATAAQRFTAGDKGHRMHVTFGNVDPKPVREDLVHLIALFETDFDDPDGDTLYQQTCVIRAGDVRVGVLGAVTDQAVFTQVPGDPVMLKLLGAENPDAQGMAFIDPVPARSDYVARGIDSLVAERADVIVLLSHVGLGFGDRVNLPPGFDDVIAQTGQGAQSGRALDLVISAHSHVQLNHPIFVANPTGGQTPIVQAREGGLFVARVDAVVDLESGGMTTLDGRLLQINGDLQEDPALADQIVDWRTKAEDLFSNGLDRELADCPFWLSHRAGSISGLGHLINDAFAWKLDRVAMPVDGSIVIPSMYRTDLWPAPVTAELAYGVVPLHKMNEVGTDPDTVAVLAFTPGRANWSILGLPVSQHNDTTALEYALEVIHSMPDILQAIPALGRELKIDVIQLAGVSYEVDLTAPAFHHVVDGSVTVEGQPVDPARTYRLAVVETFAATLSRALNTLVVGHSPGEGRVNLFLDDPATGLPYVDTQIPLWLAFQEYLAQRAGGRIAPETVTVTGRVVRTVQPDLAVNPVEMTVTDAKRGKTAGLAVRVRNLGTEAVLSARIRLLVDVTPWDATDHDSSNAVLEGLGANYLGSLVPVASQTFAVGPHPAFVDLDFLWDVPNDLPVGAYTLHARVDEVTGARDDPNTGAPFTDHVPDNDSGEQVMTYFTIE